MSLKYFKDSKICLPTEAGEYLMFNKSIGGYIPVVWAMNVWMWKNGERIPEGVVRWWR